jgi:CRP-like cAMP-binding protein
MQRLPSLRPHRSLLARIPAADRQQLLATCERVALSAGEVLCLPGEKIRHVFFPIEGSITLSGSEAGATQLGVALIGDEGMLGASLLLGTLPCPVHASVQRTGSAWRLDRNKFLQIIARGDALQRTLQRYLYVTSCQLSRTAGCARFHLAEARLARWLLMTRDRAHGDAFHLTHDYLAGVLGIRRAGVTRAASDLRAHRLIRYKRGDIVIDDNAGLERAACSCYAEDCRTYARVLG